MFVVCYDHRYSGGHAVLQIRIAGLLAVRQRGHIRQRSIFISGQSYMDTFLWMGDGSGKSDPGMPVVYHDCRDTFWQTVL